MQLLIRSRNSSGRFVRSLIVADVLILVLQTYYSIAVLYLFISDRTRWSLFVDFVQDELPCIADYVVSLARNTDVIEKELQECDHLIEETNLGS